MQCDYTCLQSKVSTYQHTDDQLCSKSQWNGSIFFLVAVSNLRDTFTAQFLLMEKHRDEVERVEVWSVEVGVLKSEHCSQYSRQACQRYEHAREYVEVDTLLYNI